MITTPKISSCSIFFCGLSHFQGFFMVKHLLSPLSSSFFIFVAEHLCSSEILCIFYSLLKFYCICYGFMGKNGENLPMNCLTSAGRTRLMQCQKFSSHRSECGGYGGWLLARIGWIAGLQQGMQCRGCAYITEYIFGLRPTQVGNPSDCVVHSLTAY